MQEVTKASENVVVRTNKSGARIITTNLIGKEEAFRLLALAESLNLPILFVGKPGVAKTGTVISYGEGYYGNSHEEAMKHTFILETDEGTKPAEVKGYPDMQKLLVENKFEKYAPIAEADFIVINEVDKASGGLRNAMLGVMNERIVFNGKDKVPCKWKVFVATCNEIPQEEKNSPFWDRFVIKHEMSRMNVGDMLKYYELGDKTHRKDVPVHIPTRQEIRDKIKEISPKKLEIFISKAYSVCTDRTLTYVPELTAAASLVWNTSIDKALIKVAEIIAGRSIAQELGKVLHTPEMKEIMDLANFIPGITDQDQLVDTIEKINGKIETFFKSGRINKDDIAEIKQVLLEVTKDHPIAQEIDFDELA
jgi:MoxR-like ATPase